MPKLNGVRQLIRPKLGELTMQCANCQAREFAVFVRPQSETTAAVSELVCLTCKTVVEVLPNGLIGKEGKITRQEVNPLRRLVL